MTDPIDVMIDSLGARGDGIAHHQGKAMFVPYALAGERVRITPRGERAELEEVVVSSADRIDPICPLFERCGGCSMQHLASEPYQNWKANLVKEALASRGLDVSLRPMITTKAGGRRRAVLTARLIGRRLLFGYHEAKSNRIVDVNHCPVLVPELSKLLPKLADILPLFMTKKGEAKITLLATSSGIDVSLDHVKDLSGGQSYLKAVQIAEDLDLARLSANGEILLERRPPQLVMGRAHVSPPPGAFTQADASAEDAMVDLVLDAVGDKAKRVIDLFCGSGTFALRLAERAPVWALEGEEAALKALEKGWRFGTNLKGIKIERRDLFRRPVLAMEMKKFDALVFDPPRAGAKAQAEEIAKSSIPCVVAVSCNPGTLARDLRILIDGGYTIESVAPVDQFLFSPHVESVAVLRK
ncbi:MAG: class I SAM-dependent RNA methyltransferase [Cohaesibacter sp.]|nr:class I SAM-dependent RNA methyltransferase [Cohaesibacter sp.]